MEKYMGKLLTLPLFNGIALNDLEKLLRCLGCYCKEYKKGAVLWLAGDLVDCAGIVLGGGVVAEQNTPAGRRVVVSHQGEGALFGDVLMSSHSRSPVDILASADLTVLFVPFANIMGGCRENCPAHERLRLNLLEEISRKFWLQQQKIAYLSLGSMRARIAHFLLDQTAGAPCCTLPCGRETMAALLGVNRSAMCRELSRLRAAGVITYQKNTFQITDLPALEGFLAE